MKQIIWILFLASILGLSLSGLIPIPKAKSNLPSAAPLQNVKILTKYADVNGKNLKLANFEVVGEVKPVCEAGGKLAVDLLLDTSTSMDCKVSKGACKIESLKSSVNNFIDKLPNDTLIGIQTLQGSFLNNDKLGVIGKDALKSKISAIKTDDSTPTQKGLQFAQTALNNAKTAFPDYKNRVLIMLTDGCPNGGQKPIPVAQEIKNDGVRIITIGLELGGAGKCDDG